jgi:hypothetical protein
MKAEPLTVKDSSYVKLLTSAVNIEFLEPLFTYANLSSPVSRSRRVDSGTPTYLSRF